MRLERGRRLICASISIGSSSPRVRRKRRAMRLHVHQHFEHGDILADAMPRAHRKGNIGKTVALFGVHPGEALGLELLRLAPRRPDADAACRG